MIFSRKTFDYEFILTDSLDMQKYMSDLATIYVDSDIWADIMYMKENGIQPENDNDRAEIDNENMNFYYILYHSKDDNQLHLDAYRNEPKGDKQNIYNYIVRDRYLHPSAAELVSMINFAIMDIESDEDFDLWSDILLNQLPAKGLRYNGVTDDGDIYHTVVGTGPYFQYYNADDTILLITDKDGNNVRGLNKRLKITPGILEKLSLDKQFSA